MNRLILTLVVLFLFTLKSIAQQSVEDALKGTVGGFETSLSAKDARKFLGKEIYVCDKVISCNLLKNSTQILDLGNRTNGLLIVVKCKTKRLQLVKWVGFKICVSGKIIRLKNKPTIIVEDESQFGYRITI